QNGHSTGNDASGMAPGEQRGPKGVKPCDNAADGRPRQRVFLVPQSGQHVPGMSAPVLLPLLRRVGRVGRGGPRGRSPPLHPQAARVAPNVGGPRGPRRDRDGVPRVRAWSRRRRSSTEPWSIEHWSKVFQFEGTPVWMAPDFGFWTDEGRLALVDWKTGGSTPDGAAFQLGCYALYAAEVLGVPPAKVDL